MSASVSVYPSFLQALALGAVSLDNDEIRVALLNDTHAFDAEDEGWSDVEHNEVDGDAYDTGGKTLQDKTLTMNAATGHVTLDADDVVWEDSTITARHAVLYENTSSEKRLIASIDLGEEKMSVQGDFIIEWHAEGILRIAQGS